METFFSHVLQDRCQRVTGFESMAASKQNRLWQKAIENLQAPAIDLLLALARLLVHAFICRCAGNFHSKYFHQRMVQDWDQVQKITSQDLAQDVSQCIMSSCRSIVSITTSPSLPLEPPEWIRPPGLSHWSTNSRETACPSALRHPKLQAKKEESMKFHLEMPEPHVAIDAPMLAFCPATASVGRAPQIVSVQTYNETSHL